MKNEYFDVLNENGEKTGKVKERNKVHKDGDWHREVYIWVINKNNEILLQRRSATKENHPNMITGSCAGHVSAGENSIDATIRELKEELNIDTNPSELKLVKTFKKSSKHSSNFINNKFSDVYILKIDKEIENIKLQEDEVSEIFWVSYEKLKEMFDNKQSDLLMNILEFEILFDFFNVKE